MRVVGIALAIFSVGPFTILIGFRRNVRRGFRVAGIREPEITLRTLSGPGGVTCFLIFFGFSLALIAGVLLIVFS